MSRGFAQLGLVREELAPSSQTLLRVALDAPRFGTVSVGYARRDFRDGGSGSLATAVYSRRLWGRFFATLSARRARGLVKDEAISVAISRSVAPRLSAGGRFEHREGRSSQFLYLQKNLPRGNGVGYRMRTDVGEAERLDATVTARSRYGSATLQLARDPQCSTLFGSLSGAVAFLGGRVTATQRITESFALVRVPEQAGVRVYADNQEVARTGKRGNAWVPALRPYQNNPIRIESRDLPIQTRIASDSRIAVPTARAGLVVEFPVDGSRSALLRLVMADGGPVPLGARVVIEERDGEPPARQEASFPVGARSEVFVTDLGRRNRLRLDFGELRCEVELELTPEMGPLPTLDAVPCRRLGGE